MSSEKESSRRSGGMNRREFVKTSAAVASTGALAIPSFVNAAGSDEIRIGLIGCGGRGTGAARDAIKADPGVVLTAMGDVFVERAEASLGRLKGIADIAGRVRVEADHMFGGFECYKQVIDSGVDVVLLVTPPVFRPEHLRYAVEKGKHIFCEKPVAVDAPGIRSVLESVKAARSKSLSLVSGLCWRYNLPQRAVFAKLREGAIGEVRAMQTTYNTGPLRNTPRQPGWSDMEWQLRNWNAFTWTSGDHIVEQAVHAIDWMAWAMGDVPPVRAFAVGGRQCREGEASGNMYDHFSVIYEYASGARGYHMCRQIGACDNDNSAYFLGTNGTCTPDAWGGKPVIAGEDSWRYEGPNPSMYQVEHDELFASIRSGEPINDGVRMSHSTLLGILGRMTAYTGKTITWEQAMNSQQNLTPEVWEWGDKPSPEVAMPGRTPFV